MNPPNHVRKLILTLIPPPTQPKEKQTLSFTDDLPTEVRLLVYGHLFETPGNYFELWAATHLISTVEARFKNVFDLYLKNKEALGVLRLSKKVHAEAAEFFYGRNNFRFSDYDGLPAMTFFHHTIGQANCDFIRHVTVHIPNSNRSPPWRGSNDRYTRIIRQAPDHGSLPFDSIQRGRGMRVPDFGYNRRQVSEGLIRDRSNFDKAVAMGFHQLQNMASLRTLEILIPSDFCFITGLGETRWSERRWSLFDNMMSEVPDGAITMRNLVKSFSFDPECWALLEQLKEESASADLTISLILIQIKRLEASHIDWDYAVGYDVLRQHRCLAEYAKVMGYRFGHATWEEDNSTYVVQYDED